MLHREHALPSGEHQPEGEATATGKEVDEGWSVRMQLEQVAMHGKSRSPVEVLEGRRDEQESAGQSAT
jgi:hypothetical protein